MRPERKAKKLFEEFLLETGNETFAKKCELIAINEIIIALTFNELQNKSMIEYWNKAKKEILKYED